MPTDDQAYRPDDRCILRAAAKVRGACTKERLATIRGEAYSPQQRSEAELPRASAEKQTRTGMAAANALLVQVANDVATIFERHASSPMFGSNAQKEIVHLEGQGEQPQELLMRIEYAP